MELSQVKAGIRVRVSRLGSAKGLIVHPEYLRARRLGVKGEVVGWVPGHGGDVWWVKQDNGIIGAYCFDEFEPCDGGR